MTSEISSKNPLKGNVLILGKGYIGTHLYHTLIQYRNTFWLSRSELDYGIQNELLKFILNNDIDLVINCSGFTGRPNVDEGEDKKDECWYLNVINPTKVLDLCNKINVKYIHISSGCIYNRYDKIFVEEDVPNFGLYDYSSFYSKSKHAFETLTTDKDLKILRVRMPVCYDLTNPRNYLKKIMGYPNLIDRVNSKTFIPDLSGFVKALIESDVGWSGQDIYNVVNPDPLSTFQVVELLNRGNEGYWEKLDPRWVLTCELDIKAPRSNCVLDNTKASKFYKFKTETEMMWMIMNNINGVSAS